MHNHATQYKKHTLNNHNETHL